MACFASSASCERGIFRPRGQTPQYCPDDVHMEEEVQLKVPVEEECIGETHGKEQGEEQRENKQSSRHTWVTMQMT